MSGGFFGKIMFINLKTQTWRIEKVDEQIYRDYIGGYGLGAHILYERMRPHVDPFGPENIVGFLAGLFVGTKAHVTGRFTVVAKSPLTGGWGDAGCGGKFGPFLKSTGYDGIFFEDISDKPVFVSVFDDEVKFHDASHVWGMDSADAENVIKEEMGRQYSVCTIGQAGENKLAIAGIFNDQGRAAARMGIGGVMGSKNLKGFAAGGTHKTPIGDPEEYQACFEKMKTEIKERLAGGAARFSQLGTTAVYANNVNINDAPIQNWKYTRNGRYSMDQALKVGGDAYVPYHKKKYACAQCTVGCGAILEVEGSDGKKFETHRPEYETIGCFGSLCLMDDPMAVMEANEACNRYGMDTISVGGTIAWLLECVENGKLTEEEKEGLDLRWGNSAILVPLIKKMAYREGFLGNLLADGSKKAAERLGRGTEAYLTDFGGVEAAMHDPRCWPGFGYGYVLDPTPGHHCQGPIGFVEHGWKENEVNKYYDYSNLPAEKYDFTLNKGPALKHLSSWFHFFNGTGMCILGKYVGYPNYPVLETMRAITGWKDMDMEEALLTGERINTVRHLFNLREGITHEDFAMKERLRGVPPLPDGPTAGITIPMEKIRCDYYNELGWDCETDMPSDATLDKLGIKEYAHKYFE